MRNLLAAAAAVVATLALASAAPARAECFRIFRLRGIGPCELYR